MQTRTRLARSTAALAPLVAAALLLAGCSGGGDDAKPSTSPAADATQGSDKGSDKGGGGAEDAGDVASEGAGCLQGEWVADMASQAAQAKDALAAAGVDGTLDFSGGVTMTFSGDTVTYTYAKQVTDITMAAEGQNVRTVMTLDGTVAGTFTATDTDATVTVTDASGVTMDMKMFMGDTPIDAGLDGYSDAAREGMQTTSVLAYTCAGDTLTMALPNASLGSGVETQLHRK